VKFRMSKAQFQFGRFFHLVNEQTIDAMADTLPEFKLERFFAKYVSCRS
jgi:hypothetical protein